MTNIYQSYQELKPTHLKSVRDMFFAEFGVAETTLQNFLKGISQPKNKYVKFFSILFDLKENLSPIVMAAPLSREYRAFEYKEYKTEAKAKVQQVFEGKKAKTVLVVSKPKPPVGLRDQARRNQAEARRERIAQRQQQAEHDSQYR